jgi:tetratricopeptide (TPR) repeat protein
MNYFLQTALWLPTYVVPFILICISTAIPAATVESQLALASELGKPVLVLATGESCPPCQALKHLVRTDQNVQAVLKRFVLLEMDVESFQFEEFSARYPHRLQAIPIVFMLRPDGKVLYGKSGGMSADQLAGLLVAGLENSGSGLSEAEARELSRRVDGARGMYQVGDVVNAYRHAAAASELASYANVVREAAQLRKQIGADLIERLPSLESRFAQADEQFSTALILAELYVSAAADPEFQQELGQMLSKYEQSQPTQTAVVQAKYTVRGRHNELHGRWQEAREWYQKVVDLDSDSPAARQAISRLRTLGADEVLVADNASVREGNHVREPNGKRLQSPSYSAAANSAAKSATVNPSRRGKLVAEDYLRLAQFYQGRHPKVAADYARQALELATSADLAAAARQLLEQL